VNQLHRLPGLVAQRGPLFPVFVGKRPRLGRCGRAACVGVVGFWVSCACSASVNNATARAIGIGFGMLEILSEVLLGTKWKKLMWL
jgi:hypothetical protein